MQELTLEELRRCFRGRLVRPGDPEYDDARKIWNGAFDQRPALIARCADVPDVVQALKYARASGLPLAVKGGGHSIPGYSMVNGGIVIDLSLMKSIHVDAPERVVRAQGGVTWGDLDRATAKFGLAVPGGQISHTGIAGLTLGGGVGWLMRKHGLVIDNLLSVELVLADGRVVTASADNEPELFWAVRGGGGNFGIATTFTYRAHPVTTIVGGPIVVALEDAEAAMRAWRDWCATVPDEMSTFAILMAAPPAPFIPLAMQGKPALFLPMFFLGSEADAAKLLAPLRAKLPKTVADLVGPMPYTAMQSAVDDTVPYGLPYYARSAHLGSLPDDAIRSAVDAARTMPLPYTQINLGLLGGAITRVSEDATAFPSRAAPWTMVVHTGWDPGTKTPDHVAWVRRFDESVQAYARGAYVNHLGDEGQERVKRVYGAKFERLQKIKAKYDPHNVFRRNQNIPPAA